MTRGSVGSAPFAGHWQIQMGSRGKRSTSDVLTGSGEGYRRVRLDAKCWRELKEVFDQGVSRSGLRGDELRQAWVRFVETGPALLPS